MCRIWDTHQIFRLRVQDLRVQDLCRIWDTHQIFRLSQFPRRVPQRNARRVPDATFAQPQNWPAIAIFSTAPWMKNLQP